MSESDGIIYFFDWRSDGQYIYIGHTEKWLQRRRAHRGAGRTLLATLRGPESYEKRIHDHFAHSRHSCPEQKSVYAAAAVFPFVEWLIRAGLACFDEADIKHLPVVPWEAIDPGVPRRAEQQLNLLSFGERNLSLQERAGRSAKFACYSSQTDEWYTPANVVEAARQAMGSIDLDPASCPAANRTVKADSYYSERVDGLDRSHPWSGNVWMNPPYGGNASAFVVRLLEEVAFGRVRQAIVLLSSQALVTQWADPAIRRASAIGVSRGRWDFDPGCGQPVSSPAGGSSLLYFGDRVAEFAVAFDVLAHVMRPCWSTTKTELSP